MPEYRYLREKIYPQLRSVRFDFYLHRKGMVKDTVHTTQVDSAYMSGVSSLMTMDYKSAVEKLRPYADYNSALAYLSAGYNHSALAVLASLDQTDPKVCYLMAMALSRLQRYDEAVAFFESALSVFPAFEFRANLDPEMSELIRIRNRKWK
jgi:tetratricopeptide (TPR) repeat protein